MKLPIAALTIITVIYTAIMVVLGIMTIGYAQDGNIFATLITGTVVVLGIMMVAIVAMTLRILKNDRKA